MRYNAGVERYQTIRNGIMGQAITGVAPLTNFLKEIERSIQLELVKFNYADALLVVQGFEDFLDGPGKFMTKDFAEDRFMCANRKKEIQIPLEELKPIAETDLGIDISAAGTDEILRDIPLDTFAENALARHILKKMFVCTLNGQLGVKLKPLSGSTAVVEGVGWSCPIGKLYGADHVLAINIQQKTGVLRTRDNLRGKEIWERFKDDLERYRKNKSSIEHKYSEIRDLVTSTKFWEEYLNL